MVKIDSILNNTDYSSLIFERSIIEKFEKSIKTKGNGKDGTAYYVKCLIRNKDIRLKPEEVIRQLYILTLVEKYHYKKENIRVEHPITIGRSTKYADIVILDKNHSNSVYIVVEVKKPDVKSGKEQLKSYCNATGAPLAIWTNGGEEIFYHRKDPNYFENILQIPNESQTLSSLLSQPWTLQDLENKDILRYEKKTLKDLIKQMEDDVLANAGVDVFEEVFKLVYIKLYDEYESGINPTRTLSFRDYGDAKEDLKNRIEDLFEDAKQRWPGVFPQAATINLTSSHLAICVSTIQDAKLLNSNLDVVDDAFEYLMNKSQKGEKGQFFTPRYVIEMCVRMLNPKQNEAMIDTAAGSCGFPVHTIFYVWRNILKGLKSSQSNLFTARHKPQECTRYVTNSVYAIDFDEKAVRVARLLNLIAGDGNTNVLHLNTLDYERWHTIEKDVEWSTVYGHGWKRLKKFRTSRGSNRDFTFDIVMANPPFAGKIKESQVLAKYVLAQHPKKGNFREIDRDILFIERNISFLKPGGRMAIVLPQGRLNNEDDRYIRDYIEQNCRILAVVGLHSYVFKPHTTTKTSVLFLQKWDDELCPRKDNYNIFFAMMEKPSKDSSGNKIWVLDSNGQPKLDSHGHLIVDHDLYNHDGLTQDGIAEEFLKFAKRESLSFVQ